MEESDGGICICALQGYLDSKSTESVSEDWPLTPTRKRGRCNDSNVGEKSPEGDEQGKGWDLGTEIFLGARKKYPCPGYSRLS